MKRLTRQEAKQYVSLKDDYTGKELEDCPHFTLTPLGDGWESVTYYTNRKKGKFLDKNKGNYWIYILSNPSIPGVLKIGYTRDTPENRAKQLSTSTGVVLPYKVEYTFKCFDGETLEKEIHNYLNEFRVNNNREFFEISLEKAKQTIETLGEQYI